jgi:hypothetical protein
MKASGRAEHVIVYSYSATSHIWFKGIAKQDRTARATSASSTSAETSAALEKHGQAQYAAAVHDPGRPGRARRCR